ncbi:DNA mismatch repair protein msh6 [Coemansia guatemalensis]|uniref:DNA mismatch repair protein n=1 Tax=Coemansia guatemalensis TaxID=2761395 RepID=A0A9W8LQZ6_9FUNG|nr:DNA mismatch repair protein msh6 [Coemansia guatemalensis]
MSGAKDSSTPKSARTQTSIFSFFSTPSTKATQSANGTRQASRDRDSQDALLDELGDLVDNDMLTEVEHAEEKHASPIATSNKRKRKAAHVESEDEEMDLALDDELADNDDDEDDDYKPEAAETAASRKRGSRSRRRAIGDSDEDEDEGDLEVDLSEEIEAAATPALSRREQGKSRDGNGSEARIPSLSRMRYSAAGSSSSASGTPLMSMIKSQTGTGKPALERASTLLMSAGTTVSSESEPLMRLMQRPAAGTAKSEAKRTRAAAFAKKNDGRYAWLVDERDAQKLRPGEAGYDKRTLYVPDSAWGQFSAFERQYWEIKSQWWDTVVFFKKGKFYELYEKDATIAHQQFDLKLTDRVNMRMAGVPEASFDHWVAQFLAKGHKVARVDQMESRLAKEMRERGNSKKGDGLVVRELTAVLTAGTLVDPTLLTQDLATHCMAIVEAAHPREDDGAELATSFGIAFVDTSTAQFRLCTVANDDAQRSGLETLLVQVNPREVVYVRGGAGPGQRARGGTDAELTSPDAPDGMAGLSQATWRVLKNTCGPDTDWIALAPRREFWDAPTTMRELKQAAYFGTDAWPAALQHAAEHERLALTSVGGLLAYLRGLRLDVDLATLGNFDLYTPLQHDSALVLDGPTLTNLDIFAVAAEGDSGSGTGTGSGSAAPAQGTLFALVDHARTAFGRRLLRRWTCHPLRHADAINARLDAVDFLLGAADVRDTCAEVLAGLPDLERGLSRIHAGRCKVADFLGVLAGLRAINELVARLRQECGTAAPARVQTLLATFPPLESLLAEFDTAFDARVAGAEGRLEPVPGSDGPYDDAQAAVTELDAWLEQHLRDTRARFDCAGIVYKHVGKEQYQLELPATIDVPPDFFRLSATKAVSRYWSPPLRAKVRARAEAVETRTMALDSFKTRLYARFARHYALVLRCVSVVAELDCLLSLAAASAAMGAPACRPTVVEPAAGAAAFVDFRQLRHPCVAPASGFVANDISLGSGAPDAASMILLTGPNMGGKSTLLRQVCLGVLLAQLGCYVPAEAATITPVDRLFTRIGARDNMLAGRSTFMVEMAETATILRHASPRSLAVLDELGRGTSTHDGAAVAFAALHGLCARVGCLGIFSTHYGLLADAMYTSDTADSADAAAPANSADDTPASHAIMPRLRPMFMACAVDEEEHRVTFLYRLQRGVASKSHGMNVAAMAGVPVPIVRSAAQVAKQFEQRLNQRRARLLHQDSASHPAALLPLSLQSDFANLLRVADLESGARPAAAADAAAHTSASEMPVAGPGPAAENQYWSCIVDHLRRTLAAAPTASPAQPI